jgi:hypothetical protein
MLINSYYNPNDSYYNFNDSYYNINDSYYNLNDNYYKFLIQQIMLTMNEFYLNNTNALKMPA